MPGVLPPDRLIIGFHRLERRPRGSGKPSLCNACVLQTRSRVVRELKLRGTERRALVAGCCAPNRRGPRHRADLTKAQG